MKKAIAKLIRQTKELKEFKDLGSELISPMFKYKIMYLYNPDIMLPSFLLDDLLRFESCLGIKTSKNFEEAQKELLAYKNTYYPNKSNHEFMAGLYEKYGKYDFKQIIENEEKADYELNKKILEVSFDKASEQDIDDYITHPVDKVPLIKTDEGTTYPRNAKYASIALTRAKHKCENIESHECFIKRKGNIPYTEVHHLIPLAYHNEFEKSLDNPANIVSLCSNCHNEIHYGKDADKIIEKLYYKRKEELHLAGLDISLNKLLDMYHKLGNYK